MPPAPSGPKLEEGRGTEEQVYQNPVFSSDHTSSIGGGSSSSHDFGAADNKGHLRKMTASLVNILEQLSGSVQPGQGVDKEVTPHGSPSRHNTLRGRGDSVASFPVPDLEAQFQAQSPMPSPQGPASPQPNDERVPVQHVHRLTNTLVDILRHVAAVPQQGQLQQSPQSQHHRSVSTGSELGGPGVGELDFEALQEGSNLLGSQDDKVSISSGSTTSAASSLGARLLHASYTKDEYKGDDVQPFFVDPLTPYTTIEERPEEAVDREVSGAGAAGTQDYSSIPQRLQKQRRINWWGLFCFLAFLGAFGFYVFARATYTLGLGPLLWYGGIMLAVEILGGIAVIPYALCLTMRVVNNKAPPPDEKGLCSTVLPYHIRVVIPCYREPLDVISKTVMAALYASIPAGCKRTVYLLDDGKDHEKKKWMHSLNLHNVVYISGRKRKKGEINGKSANINNAMGLIYPAGVDIPLTEVICLFDADQCPNADFFLKTVPLLDGGQDVAMVLSPQTFYNLNPDGDIFNHANVHFWDYTQPGYDALGLISCTGTNFLLRSKAFQQAGWFPEWTLTEDFALGIELKKRDWQCRYVNEYLAIGEAPDDVRNCFQQRSRWSKGHFQVFFSKHNPVFSKNLSLLMRWMYGSVILSYFSAFLSTPLLLLVPMITVWLGAFPIVINFWAAVSITVYYGATIAVMYYTRTIAHLKSMWFASVANSILWFAFLKAMYRATLGRLISGAITFKVTAKGLQKMKDSALRDVWVSLLFTLAMTTTLILGIVHWSRGNTETPLIISLVYMVYNIIPQYLLLQYAVWRRKPYWNWLCKLAALLSTVCAIGGVILIWILYPKTYDYKEALSKSVYFFDTQRIGVLPPSNDVSYRRNAFTQEQATPVYLAASMDNLTMLGGLGLGGFGSDFNDPFAGSFGGRRLRQDPFAPASPASGSDPFASASGDSGGSDPFASSGDTSDPFGSAGGGSDPFASAGGGSDPFASSGSGSEDPFAASGSNDPFGGSDPFAESDPFAGVNAPPATPLDTWDLEGGWMAGMQGGNIKMTHPIAFSTLLLSWSLMAFPKGFTEASVMERTLESIKWGADYLMKVHRYVPETNESLIITRVGDVDTEMMLWYRPEESSTVRDGYAVSSETGASDLGGSVSAALAASSVVFQSLNDTDYAKQLLDKSREVYDFARVKYGSVRDGDFNSTQLYNSSTYYDDLAWAAGWLYKATKKDDYLANMYDYYVKHLTEEGSISDFKFAFDWDNVFWPLNLLMAQETDKGTFHKQTELFLRNWICAGNAANYTTKGRAYNPMSGSTGATANAAFMALMYADQIESSKSDHAHVYKCWGMSQVRYMLGDAGHSLVVDAGNSPPQRTQDRAAACPDPPQVCNRVTGLLSPDPDAHKLSGALLYGTGRSDSFDDVRSADSNWVGIENNAGFVGAVAGTVELPNGLWEQCLQKYGIFRSNPVCGTYLLI